jgi:hypothetical protein
MKRFQFLLTSLSVIVILPCAAKEPFQINVGYPPPRYQFMIQDNPANLRFDLIILSHDDRPICISHGGWPDDSGHVDWGSQDVKVESRQRSFPARDWDFGYCENGECTTRIPPHGTLRGFINYEEFGDPKEIAGLPDRRLIFETTPHLCSRNKRSPAETRTAALDRSEMVDHLVPVNDKELPAYRADLQSKLLITPADVARMIVRPAGQPESAVSVYLNPPASVDDVARYKVTVTRASASIWFIRAPVETTRSDAELPASVALLIKEVWEQMLLATRSYNSPVDSPADGSIVEFALLEPNQSALHGELPINAGSDILAFQSLGTLLVKYCDAPATERNALATEIAQAARNLLKRKSDLRIVRVRDSLRLVPHERQLLKKKAKNGDPNAADKLSMYYGIYRSDKTMEVRYLKLAVKNNSDVALRNLMTLYSTDSDFFNFRKALTLRAQLKSIAQTRKMNLKSDADWGYDRYLDQFLGGGDKSRGLFFLEYAARNGSERAFPELIRVYSNDPDVRDPERARYWQQKSELRSKTGKF